MIRAFHGRVRALPEVVVNVSAATPGLARAEILRQAREAGYDARYTDVQVRSGEWIHGVSVWLESAARPTPTQEARDGIR